MFRNRAGWNLRLSVEILLAVLGLSLVAGHLGIERAEERLRTRGAFDAPGGLGTGGAMIVRDAITGDFREADAEEAAALSRAFAERFSGSRAKLAGVRNKDGSWTLDLGGLAFAAARSQVRSDGEVVSSCGGPEETPEREAER